MKVTSTILTDFIGDFKLDITEFGVCFDAVINFNLPNENFNVQSEVFMEPFLSHRIDTVHLLSPLISKFNMPCFFNDVNHQFLYLYRTGLIITGDMRFVGAYSVSIFPRSQICTKKTFDELRAKKLN